MSPVGLYRDGRPLGGSGPGRPPSLWRLVAALVLVLLAIWYLSRLG